MQSITNFFAPGHEKHKEEHPSAGKHAAPPTRAENLDAFKMITTMLSMLKRSKAVEIYDNLKNRPGQEAAVQDRYDRQETKILDALARLSVGEHDVAALATNISSPSRDQTTLRMLFCADTHPINKKLSSSPSDGIIQWPLMYFRNLFQSDPDKTIVEELKIHTPSEPSDIEGLDVIRYMQKLNALWRKPSMDTHLWILTKALCKPQIKTIPILLETLSKYAVGVSYERMHRRFFHKYLSTPFITALKAVIAVPEISQSMAITKFSEEDQCDYLFMSDFMAPYSKHGDKADIAKYPKLVNMAANLPDKGSFLLYTTETRVEFHNLLIHLLSKFSENLAILHRMEYDSLQKKENPDKDLGKKFYGYVQQVDIYGYALLKISRGRAFRMHLENIEHLLLTDDPRKQAKNATSESQEDFQAAMDDPPSLSDGDSLCESYVAWLRLMVNTFDAVHILITFVTHFQNFSISLSILDAPAPTADLLSWKELFVGDRFIPSADGTGQGAKTSNDEILQFLTKGTTNCRSRQLIRELAKEWSPTKLAELARADFQPYSDRAKVIINNATLATKESQARKPRYSSEVRAVVALWQGEYEETETAQDKFFGHLNEKNVFTGTLHCEACLASLLPAFTNNMMFEDRADYDIDPELQSQMKEFGKVIGVSKRSCPACAIFLSKLNSDFIVRGNHGTYSACSLPPWTPNRIVKDMNTILGMTLRQDIVALMNSTPVRPRCQSTGSAANSTDSAQSIGKSSATLSRQGLFNPDQSTL